MAQLRQSLKIFWEIVGQNLTHSVLDKIHFKSIFDTKYVSSNIFEIQNTEKYLYFKK